MGMVCGEMGFEDTHEFTQPLDRANSATLAAQLVPTNGMNDLVCCAPHAAVDHPRGWKPAWRTCTHMLVDRGAEGKWAASYGLGSTVVITRGRVMATIQDMQNAGGTTIQV